MDYELHPTVRFRGKRENSLFSKKTAWLSMLPSGSKSGKLNSTNSLISEHPKPA